MMSEIVLHVVCLYQQSLKISFNFIKDVHSVIVFSSKLSFSELNDEQTMRLVPCELLFLDFHAYDVVLKIR